MAEFNEVFLEQTRAEYRRLYAIRPYSASAYLREVAAEKGVNMKTLHRNLKLSVRKPREIDIATQARQAEIDSYTRMIWEVSVNKTFDLNTFSVQTAYEELMREKRLPSDLTMNQIYVSMRRQHLRNHSAVTWKKIPENRKPMDTWQMDFSKSRYFKHRVSGDGEIMCVDPVTTKRQDDGKSLWFGIAIDMASRVMFVQYFLSAGENAESVIEFMLHAFDTKPGMLHLQGVPRSAYVDNGTGWTNERMVNGMKKLGIEEILGGFETDTRGRKLPKRNKQGRGMVERAVNTVKNKMEAALFYRLGSGRKLYVKDLNEAVGEWLEEWNQGPHPMNREESKMNRFMEVSGKQFENLMFPPEDARAFFSRAIMRKVVRRKIHLAKNLDAFAPAFVDDDQTVEVVQNQNGWYLFLNGEMHKLQLEGTPEAKAITGRSVRQPRTSSIAKETKDAKLSDLALRKRFEQELVEQLRHDFRGISDDEWTDLQPFFEVPRSVAEIEEKVKWMALTRAMANEQPVSMSDHAARPDTAKIIQLPQESYLGRNQL